MFNNKSRTLIIFIMMLSFKSFAEVKFEFEGLFPNKIMRNFLNSVNGSYKDKDVGFEFNAEEFIPGLFVEEFLFDYDLDLEVSLDDNGEIGGFFNLPQARLRINQVDLNLSTQSDVGGALINIATKLQCEVAFLNMKNLGGFVKGQLAIEEGRFLFDKERAAMELGDLSKVFSIDLEDCEGAKGLESVIKEELINWMVSEAGKTELLNIVVDSIIEFINDKMMEFQEQGYEVPFINKMLRLKMKSGYFMREGFSFKGEAFFDHNENVDFLLEENINALSEEAIFRLPTRFASKILPMFVLSSDDAELKLDRKAIPGADLLFNNRFIQFFVWSDLLNFKESTDFDLSVNLNIKQALLQDFSPQSLKFHLYSEHDTNFDLKNSNGRAFPYMDFNGRLSTTLNFSISEKGFSFSLDNFGVEAKSEFDPLMYDWRKNTPGGKPWMSMVLKQAREALNKTSFSWEWSEVGLNRLDFKSVGFENTKKGFDIKFTL